MNSEILYKISVDMEQLAYKISHLEEEMARLNATVEEVKGENDDKLRRMES